jgi:hypothetical protein
MESRNVRPVPFGGAALLAACIALTAGVAVIGSPAQASSGRQAADATAETASAGTAARKPLRAERRTDIDAIACGTSIEPSGVGSTVVVTHYNCSDSALALAMTAQASDGSVAFTSECQQFLAGEAWYWEITSPVAARRPTFLYRVAGCA